MYDDTVIRERYTFPSSAFGATTVNQSAIGPKGRKGIVRDIQLYMTATMVGTTTVPEVTVGTASADPSYARFRLGTTATSGYTTGQQAVRRATTEAGYKGNGTNVVYEDYTGHVKLGTAYIPADTIFVMSTVQGVGGTPAGTGIVTIDIDWI